MAKLMLVGSRCTVKIHFPGSHPDDGLDQYSSVCLIHGFIDVEASSLLDAVKYAADHCDG